MENQQQLEEGQLVLCTVTKILGTIVFVKIQNHDTEGTITFSEISPGRIRNIRDYAFPGKKIICKILQIRSSDPSLSLRRVKLKEKTEFNEKLRQEKSIKAIFKTVLKEDSEEILETIIKSQDLSELVEDSKSDINLLTKFVPKAKAQEIIKIINEKKTKEKSTTRNFNLSSKEPEGIITIKSTIKESLENIPAKITYLAAGRYSIKIKSQDLKKADTQINTILESLESAAKQKNLQFSTV